MIRLLTLLLFACLPFTAQAQSNPAYIPLGQAKGVLYKPDSGPAGPLSGL